MSLTSWCAVAAVTVLALVQQPFASDPPKVCDQCETWNRRIEPFTVFGNTHYVGVEGLSSVLITSSGGHVLLDGALPQSAPIIAENIVRLGFKVSDVKLIVNSHAHYDHAGGIHALQRASGAEVAASVHGAGVLRRGYTAADDPQFGFGRAAVSFPAVPNVREVKDGETLRIGDIELTARYTPGHTPGSTTWTWRSCVRASCRSVVYADSLNAVSHDDFKFTAHPGLVETFRRSMATVRALPCDILLPVHPAANLDTRRKLLRDGELNPFFDPDACRKYAGEAAQRLDARVASEKTR